MVNLIAGEEVVPELVQHDFTAERVVARLKEIISDGTARRTMLEGLAGVKARLRSPDSGDPRPAAERAADAILELMAHRQGIAKIAERASCKPRGPARTGLLSVLLRLFFANFAVKSSRSP